MSHNIHVAIHLADDVKKYGSLDSFSAFPFENFMQALKKNIISGLKPLQQLTRRYAEYRVFNNAQEFSKRLCGPINAVCKEKQRPMLQNACNPQYTGWRTYKFSLKLNFADNCVKKIQDDIVIIENIATEKSNNDIIIIGRQYEHFSEFFNSPCSTKIMSIQVASKLSHLKSWPLEHIKEKLLHLPMKNNTSLIIPFLHS